MSFQVIPGYLPNTANGNACYSCGAAQRTLDGGRLERVVDLGTIEFEGHLAVCETCCVQIARELGMADTGVIDQAAAEAIAARADAANWQGRAERAEAALDSLRSVDNPPLPAPEPEPAAETPSTSDVGKKTKASKKSE